MFALPELLPPRIPAICGALLPIVGILTGGLRISETVDGRHPSKDLPSDAFPTGGLLNALLPASWTAAGRFFSNELPIDELHIDRLLTALLSSGGSEERSPNNKFPTY